MRYPEELKNRILKAVEKLHPQQIKWRRHLHQYPELSFEEYQTTVFLKKECQKAGLKILPLKMKTGLLAETVGTGKTKLAMRTDIDALPVTEKADVPFRSKNIGCAHMCGHDVHMATVLGTAVILQQFKKELPGSVRFIFQPAEEFPPGGARPMIDNGALKDISFIFGLHVDPDLAVGKVSFRDGVTMGSVFDFNLTVHGKGGHAARPHTAVDAIVIASEVVNSIQKIVAREIDPIDPVVITFGQIKGGTARNVICDKVELVGTARTLSKKTAHLVPKLIKRTAENICRAHGAKAEIEHIADYPVLTNHPEANKILSVNYKALFGQSKIETTPVVLGGEDFACYLEKVKGAMFRLGIKNSKIKADQPWHSPYFKVDENALKYGTALLVSSAFDYLYNKK